MKRFRFPLRPVAVLRSHKELRAREAFAAAVHLYVRAEERLAAVRRRMADLEDLLAEARNGRFLAADAASLFRVYRSECQAEMETEREVIEFKDAMQKRRGEYIEANRQMKAVELLENKARTRFRAEMAKAEQNELDEFAGTNAFRRSALS